MAQETLKLPMAVAYQYLMDLIATARALNNYPAVIPQESYYTYTFFAAKNNAGPIFLTKDPPAVVAAGNAGEETLLAEESKEFIESPRGWYARGSVGDFLIFEPRE